MSGYDPLFEVNDKTVIVAGAGGALGGAISRALHERGARLLLFDIDGPRLQAVATDLPGAEALMADIRDETALRGVASRVLERFGRLDAVVNAAGVFPISPALEADVQEYRDCIDVNLTGAFLLSRVAAEAMGEGGGRIVHLASVSSIVANPEYAAYASSKGGLSHLVRVLGREWACRGIAVNAIGPALTETPLTAGYLADPEFRARALAVIPMGRLGEAADLIGAVILLLSPGGAFITGQTIYVDGGRVLV